MARLRRRYALFLALALAGMVFLIISACGKDGDSAPAQTPDPTSITTPTPGVGEADSTPTPTPTQTLPRGSSPGDLAPELVGTQAWINSEPLQVDELRGKVVLIDFWTYTCVNCIRTLPFLKVWHSKYADDGLVIIGVHTPEFQFEHDLENVQQAVMDYGVGWPVVQDNDYKTWRAFNNRYWPAKYLIDKEGVVRYTHFGEGAYDETEGWIRTLLEEAGSDISAVEPLDAPDQPLDFIFQMTRADLTDELYGGYERTCGFYGLYSNSSVDHSEYCNSRDQLVFYEDPGVHRTHQLYLQGPWLAEKESLRHGRETSGFEDYMLLRFAAKSVNVVLRPEEDETFKVLATLDGEFLDESNRGGDVVIEEDGRSFLVVEQAKLYHVVEAPTYGTYDLKLSSNSADFAVFAFTFGVYVKGP